MERAAKARTVPLDGDGLRGMRALETGSVFDPKAAASSAGIDTYGKAGR